MPEELEGVELGSALSQLQGSMNTLVAAMSPEQQVRLHQREEFQQAVDSYEKSLKPWHLVWRVIGFVLGGVGIIFAAGVGYQQFLGGNATKADITEHAEIELVPVRVQVRKNTKSITGVQGGVDTLLRRGEAEAEVEEAQQVAEVYRQEYDELITEWAASKAAGKKRAKPSKRKELIEAELAVRKAQKKLLKVQ